MGDKAETVFKQWAPQKGIQFIEWGLNRPPFDNFRYLPLEIRAQPDMLCEDADRYIKKTYFPGLSRHMFVEAKGVGRDQIVKIKVKHLKVMQQIEDFFKRRVLLFVFDSAHNRVSISKSASDIALMSDTFEVGEFHEGNKYYRIPTGVFKWELLQDPL